jgi:hypothetical protein
LSAKADQCLASETEAVRTKLLVALGNKIVHCRGSIVTEEVNKAGVAARKTNKFVEVTGPKRTLTGVAAA